MVDSRHKNVSNGLILGTPLKVCQMVDSLNILFSSKCVKWLINACVHELDFSTALKTPIKESTKKFDHGKELFRFYKWHATWENDIKCIIIIHTLVYN